MTDQPDQPELDLVRIAFHATTIMAKKIQNQIQNNNHDSITAMPIPESMRESYQKKFQLYKKFDECAEKIKCHILQQSNISNSIIIPPELHSLLKDKDDLKWDIDSRIEVFENLIERVEEQVNDDKFIKCLSKKHGEKVNYIIFVNLGYTDEDSEEENTLFAEIHVKKTTKDIS